ncbi:hypothetical protein JQC67_11725 [Aurantibacter crassamenti]|uniref:thioesterase domain-containing protein n=1 Tax=Aurantibacter crassamenti TaxID=1837375 RepID=UPI0019395D49|nr:thioesterase domain-containing protein [Aurantibacter crassamenti]MBM1106811.1 hypothetical protein [Aurantibacter crassamenti]
MIETALKNRIEALSPMSRELFLHKVEQSLQSKSEQNQGSDTKRLVAYVKGNDNFDLAQLKSYLSENLPDFMIPSLIVPLDEIPTLPNGKVDKNRLSEYKEVVSKKPTTNNNDLSEAEMKLSTIWEEVLNFSPIDINDNFFEIGGDSILSIQIIAKARKEGLMISPNQLFEHQTIAALCKSMAEKVDATEKWDFLVPLRKEGTKKPIFCVHSGGGHVFFYNQLVEYLKPNRPIYALQSSGLDGNDDMHESIEAMTADYIKAMRVVQPEGPYNVLVYCFSATIGNEMAIQLAKLNQEINIIVMDTMASPWTLGSSERVRARVRSFFKRFYKKPLTSIKLYFEDRFWRISPMWYKLFGSENEKALEKVKINLRNICLAYEWKKHPGKVSLILTEKPHESLQKVTIDSWKELSAEGNIELYYTKGNHRTLFEKPDVQFVSEKIDEAITD